MKRGLGKGLLALIGDAQDDEEQLAQVVVENVIPNPDQPRASFKPEELEELQNSIVQNGVLQPILVTPFEDKYMIIAGERRWRASKMLGLVYIPAIIKKVSKVKAIEIALVENIQRESLMPLEEAESYKKLLDDYSYTQEKIAEMVSKSRSHVANLLRLLTLPEKVKEYLNDGLITLGHAKLLVNLDNATEAANFIVSKNLNVREAENFIKYQKDGVKPNRHHIVRSKIIPKAEDVGLVEDALGAALGIIVKVDLHGNGGTIKLHCDNLEQMDRIIQKLSDAVA